MYFSTVTTVTSLIFLLISQTEAAIGACYEPGPAFPIPEISASLFESSQLAHKLDLLISNTLNTTYSAWSWENSSFAIQLTSSSETLWSSYYTAPILGNYSDGNPTPVSGDTAFRIASCSKTFTVYALLLEKGIGLEDPITKYLPELNGERDKDWGELVDWDHISIRALASQQSGIGRGNGNPDLSRDEIDGFNAIDAGLPQISSNDTYVKPCMGYSRDRACTKEEIIQMAKNLHPIFSPNDRSSYSNIAFSLLGLALEKVTAKSYAEIIQTSVLNPLKMHHTTTQKPNDSKGIIPAGKTDWAQVLGPDDPSGGIYSTTNDLSKYLRSILTSSLLPKSTTNYWMKPHSWTSSRTNSAYGMPWEILRTTKATPDSHPTDIITKGGSLGGYYSTIALLPEYGLGLTVLTATPDQPVLFKLQELILEELIPNIDALVRNQARETYTGFYGFKDDIGTLKSDYSISLEVDDNGPGLRLSSWKLNNTDFLKTYGMLRDMPKDADEWEARLIPTNVVRKNDEGLVEEAWRLTAIMKVKEVEGIYSDFCVTDVDGLIYGGWSLEEFVFRGKGLGKEGVDSVFIPGARTLLFKGDGKESCGVAETGRVPEQQVVFKGGEDQGEL